MLNNLKNWQKSVLILIIFYISIYALGKLFVPVEVLDHEENYKWPPLIYSAFFVLPRLIDRYAGKRYVRAIARLIFGIFFLFTFLPLLANFSVFYANAYSLSGNSLIALFSLLYMAPLNGGIVFLSFLNFIF